MVSDAADLPRVGDPAPDFRLPSTEGRQLSVQDFLGQRAVVLYFYPQDDTPDCTREARAFQSLRQTFNAHGVEILGISTDSLRSHARFRKRYGLDFPLLADTKHAVAERYGVWRRIRFLGRDREGVARTTFVVGRDGRIKAVFPDVKVEGHAEAVLAAVEAEEA